ncbi:MAG: hypothetical protein ACR2KQ_04080 [Actinomycetota bacterium]
MITAHPRVLAVSCGVGLAISLVAGTLFAWLGDKLWLYAVGTMLFISGMIALVVGLSGALEPREGWATGRGARSQEAQVRSIARQVTNEHPGLEDRSGWALAVWGVVVGGGLIALAMLAFAISE